MNLFGSNAHVFPRHCPDATATPDGRDLCQCYTGRCDADRCVEALPLFRLPFGKLYVRVPVTDSGAPIAPSALAPRIQQCETGVVACVTDAVGREICARPAARCR